jgi:membrane protein implicated in regulation of membrane protease activity
MRDFGSPRMLVLMTLATVLVIGGILALATGSWWALVIPVVLHVIGTGLVLTGVFSRVEQGDKPDPVTEARLDEERVQGAR